MQSDFSPNRTICLVRGCLNYSETPFGVCESCAKLFRENGAMTKKQEITLLRYRVKVLEEELDLLRERHETTLAINQQLEKNCTDYRAELRRRSPNHERPPELTGEKGNV